MKTLTIFVLLLFSCGLFAQSGNQASADVYTCTPCGHDCDHDKYTGPGKCPHCSMALVKKSTIVFKTISPEEICNYLQQHPDVVLLDVRTKEEFEGKKGPVYGKLKNAINIPIQELPDRLQSISSMKDKEIIVYCSKSIRSPQAAYLLTQNGFTNITNMSGGISTMPDAPCKE
jgi:rhodanese-related sulfurtransferase/DNA-directed RNA polymerase subunit RPC12/RpoP